jgi:4-hydroxybenzoate polyprenyltransferase
MVRADGIKSWIQLLRVPNLFTVPGDPLAGFCLACLAMPGECSPPVYKPILLPFISLLLYASGLILNDYFDFEEDRLERPSRPLPSGRIAPFSALFVGLILAFCGILIGFSIGVITGMLSIILVLFILGYNAYYKSLFLIGPLNMGLCRGFSFLLGSGSLGWKGIFNLPVISTFIYLSLFIAAITHIASKETRAYEEGGFRWIPLIVISCWILALVSIGHVYTYPFKFIALLLSCVILGWTYYSGSLLVHRASPEVIQKTIGRFIRTLILIQAALVSLIGGGFIFLAMVILLGWPVSQQLSRKFYAS